MLYECHRSWIGDAVMEGPSGPVIDWPEEWGAWSLADHRQAIAEHHQEREKIEAEERRRTA